MTASLDSWTLQIFRRKRRGRATCLTRLAANHTDQTVHLVAWPVSGAFVVVQCCSSWIHQRKTHQTAKLCCNFFQKLEASHDPSWPVHRCLFLGSRQLGDWHGWAASPVWWIHGSRDSSPPVALTLWSEWPARRCSSKDQGIVCCFL